MLVLEGKGDRLFKLFSHLLFLESFVFNPTF